MHARTSSLLVIGCLGLAGTAFGQQALENLGKYEYMAKCASCHGVTGKGDGPMRSALVKAPPDLTTYARRNGGAFPTQLAWQVIDGRLEQITAHGSREMPVWGQDFRRDALRANEATPNPEWQVAGRISALVDYLASIQVK